MRTEAALQEFDAHKHPNREQTIKFIKILCEEAEKIPIDQLAQQGDGSFRLRYPLKKGVDVVSLLLGAILPYDWADDQQYLQEIAEIGGELYIHTDDQVLWRGLFGKVKELNATPSTPPKPHSTL